MKHYEAKLKKKLRETTEWGRELEKQYKHFMIATNDTIGEISACKTLMLWHRPIQTAEYFFSLNLFLSFFICCCLSFASLFLLFYFGFCVAYFCSKDEKKKQILCCSCCFFIISVFSWMSMGKRAQTNGMVHSHRHVPIFCFSFTRQPNPWWLIPLSAYILTALALSIVWL